MNLFLLIFQLKRFKANFHFIFHLFSDQYQRVKINPYIRHWDIARFDRSVLEDVHRTRHKRDLEKNVYGRNGGDVVKLNFIAHDR